MFRWNPKSLLIKGVNKVTIPKPQSRDDEVVFTGVVNANGEVEIPDTLVGLIELRIYRGGTSFVGEFEP